MKITLVRHGQTEQNYSGKIQGRSNHLLNDSGRRECVRLKNKLKDKHFDICYMSPLIRCVETSIIVIGDRVETKVDERLIERGMGDLEGKDYSLYDHKLYWDYELNSDKLGVEPLKSIFKRCRSFLSDIKKMNYDSVLVVAHGGVYRVLRHLLLNHPIKGYLYDGIIKNCQAEEFEI